MHDLISRRQLLMAGALTATLPLDAALSMQAATPASWPFETPNPADGAWARWLDGEPPAVMTGATWGMPWPRGQLRRATQFALRDAGGNDIAVQSWPLAFWPDGSLKWTAHAVAADLHAAGPFHIVPQGRAIAPSSSVTVSQDSTHIVIDTGTIRCRLPLQGSVIIESIERAGRSTLIDGRLVMLRQDAPIEDAPGAQSQELFESSIDRVEIEQRGPVRSVVKIEGRHAAPGGRRWLPFTLRLYFHAGAHSIRMLHTIVFDGDESQDFIRGIGLRFAVPLADALHDRHVRFAGEGAGVFAEAVRGLTGLRRDPGAQVRAAQIAGEATPPVESFAPSVAQRLELIPAFGDWTLLQASADAFTIRKRTRDGYGWLDSDRGRRAGGLGYIGGPSGGVAFGIRNFWQSHPGQLDVRDAASERAEVTMWLWAPGAAPMDLRFYHDGMGQDDYASQREGLEITYEDFEPGSGTPLGVARTSELDLWILESTPSRERLVQIADAVRRPPRIVATPQTLHEAGVFGGTFAAVDRGTPQRRQIETQLDWLFDFYKSQQDERSWYGFWNYGDVMHSYDFDRHVWRYDVGGFAWDNSELSTDIWLWLYFLRTGRADVFRFAEAMTRHTGEVDVHHLGRFAPLGSRHNVMHWGCSAKQLRISTALNRRYYYYLTADERVGDLMREQVEAARTLRTIVPGRKLPDEGQRSVDPEGDFAWLGFGTDWGSVAGAWLTEWERTQDKAVRQRLLASMRSIAAQPKGFFTGSGRMNLRTGAFDISTDPRVSVSHLSAAFGLPEVCAELLELLPDDGFTRAWLQYCELYNAPAAEKRKVLGGGGDPPNLIQGHARLTAFAAHRMRNDALAQRAWREFFGGPRQFGHDGFASRRVEGPAVLNAVDESPGMSTNSAAQWGLAAIECLAWAGAALDSK